MKIWITRDRRMKEHQVYNDLFNGNIHSLYFNPDAAESARYATETVWEIKVKVTAYERIGRTLEKP